LISLSISLIAFDAGTVSINGTERAIVEMADGLANVLTVIR
jgi:hypothetical protein